MTGPESAERALGRIAGFDLGDYDVPEDQRWGVTVLPAGHGVAASSVSEGLSWLVPCFSVYGGAHVGRVALPPHPLASSPIALASGPDTITAAAEAGAAIRFVWFRQCFAHLNFRNRHLGRWPGYRERIAEVHQRLGTTGIERLDAVVEELRPSTLSFITRTEETEVLYARLARVLDPDPQHAAYLDWGERIVVAHRRGSTALPDAPPEGLGPWTPAADALYFHALAARGASADVLGRAAWRLMLNPPGLDVFPDTPTLFRQTQRPVDAIKRAAQAVSAAKGKLGSAIEDDPLFPAVVRAGARAEKYDGRAHITAAGEFEAAGQPVRAWWAVAHATWWLTCVTRRLWSWRIYPPLITLAEKNGWADIAEALRWSQPGGERWEEEEEEEP